MSANVGPLVNDAPEGVSVDTSDAFSVKNFSGRECRISPEGIRAIMGCSDAVVSIKGAQCVITTPEFTFSLTPSGVLSGPLPKHQRAYKAEGVEEHDTEVIQKLAQIALINGKLVWVPLGTSQPGQHECPPGKVGDGTSFLERVKAIAVGIMRRLTGSSNRLNGAQDSVEVAGECWVDKLTVYTTVSIDAEHLKEPASEDDATLSYTRGKVHYQIMSDGSMREREESQWVYHAREPGDPINGFAWNEITHKY